MTLIAVASLVLTVLAGSGTDREYAGGRTDTTFAVKAGARLELDDFGGEIAVRAWAKDAVRIEASHSRRVWIEVEHSDGSIKIGARSRHGVPASVEYRLSVPAWMPLDLSGISTEISVEGTKGEIKAQTVHGDVRVRGGAGFVSLESVDGEVSLVGARGRIELGSVNQGVRVSDVVGEVSADAVNGDILLDHIDSKSVEASTVNGDLYCDGDLKEGGVYSFSTHNGDIVVGLPEHPDVAVSVSTFSGSFSSSIPIQLRETRRGKNFSFVLGAGSARLELESFQGAIRLVRHGEAAKGQVEKAKSEGHEHEEDH